MREKLQDYLELVMFRHTVFALPFALVGAFLASGGFPETRRFVWVVLAMLGARTAAMAFNRIADRRWDAINPRTAARALVTGEVRVWEAWSLAVASIGLFLVACQQLNPLTLALSPLALALVLGYSLSKRITWLSHVWLGAALAFAPFGGWVAVRGAVAGYPAVLSLGVLAWVAGFDVVYACQDTAFDRDVKLCSLPARFGPRRALLVARASHALAFAAFAAFGLVAGLGLPYVVALAAAGVALVAQHLVVDADDLSRIELSFFQLNGAVSSILFAGTWLSLALGGVAW